MFSNTLKYKRLLKTLKEVYDTQVKWQSKKELYEAYYRAQQENIKLQALKEFNSCLEDKAYTRNMLLQETARLVHLAKFSQELNDRQVEECCGGMMAQAASVLNPVHGLGMNQEPANEIETEIESNDTEDHSELKAKLDSIESLLGQIKTMMGQVQPETDKFYYLENMNNKLRSQRKQIKESINS